jgi:hypothetical protein
MAIYTAYENNIIAEFKKNTEPICNYCKKVIQTSHNKNDLTVDHKTPISRGGKTVHSNLAISCLKCNQEKADMTEKEYKKFKISQKKFLKSLVAVKLSNAALVLFEDIIDNAQKANAEYNQAMKEVQRIENEIASKSFTAANSLQAINSLKTALNVRDTLKQQKETLNLLHCLVAPMKKTIDNANIINTVLQDKYTQLKAESMEWSSVKKVVSITNNNELSS